MITPNVKAIFELCRDLPGKRDDVAWELAGALVAILAVTHDKRTAQRRLRTLTRKMKELLDNECDIITTAGRKLERETKHLRVVP